MMMAPQLEQLGKEMRRADISGEAATIEREDDTTTSSRDVNALDDDGLAPLHHASLGGDSQEVVRLFNEGADLNTTTEFPKGDLPYKHMRASTAIYLAAEHGHTDTVRVLASLGADIRQRAANGSTPIHAAAKNGECGAVQALCELGVDVDCLDEHGGTPAFAAAFRGHTETVHVLARLGADVNKARLADSLTPVCTASERGHTATVVALGRLGVDVDATDFEGRTPVYAAAAGGHPETVRALVCEFGADLNKTDASGRTPLYAAVAARHLDVVRVLCELGADVNIIARNGWSVAQRLANDMAIKDTLYRQIKEMLRGVKQ